MRIIKYLKSKFKKDKLGTVPIPVYFHTVTREEKLTIHVAAAITEKNRDYLQSKLVALGSTQCLRDVHSVEFIYRFDIQYLDGVNSRFESLIELLERKDVVVESASLSELNHGKALIYEMLSAISKVQMKLLKRERRR